LSSFVAEKDNKAEVEAADKLLQIKKEANSLQFSDLDKFLDDLQRQSSNQGKIEEAISVLDMSRSGSSTIRSVLHTLLRDLRPQLATFRSARTIQLSRCTVGIAKLLKIARSLRFFEATVNVLRSAESGRDAPDCPICLEPMTTTTAALLPCAHAFHMHCVGALLDSNIPSCPTCRNPFGSNDPMLISGGGSNNGVSRKDVEAFGSKLVVIARTLKEIQSKEPASKAIVFVQWKALETLVGEALSRLGIDYIRLQGTAVQRSRAIAAFQKQASPKVLLQSLENSASGANLTRANHVLLVHPMDADSPERAVAYEMQALGRVRRCGQEADRVHLYRFVTRGTVEEEISREHQIDLSAGINFTRIAGAAVGATAGA